MRGVPGKFCRGACRAPHAHKTKSKTRNTEEKEGTEEKSEVLRGGCVSLPQILPLFPPFPSVFQVFRPCFYVCRGLLSHDSRMGNSPTKLHKVHRRRRALHGLTSLKTPHPRRQVTQFCN